MIVLSQLPFIKLLALPWPPLKHGISTPKSPYSPGRPLSPFTCSYDFFVGILNIWRILIFNLVQSICRWLCYGERNTRIVAICSIMLLPVSAVTIRLSHDDDTAPYFVTRLENFIRYVAKCTKTIYFYTSIHQIVLFHNATLSPVISLCSTSTGLIDCWTADQSRNCSEFPQTDKSMLRTLNGNAE